MLEERPDWVLVYGDTNSTLAGALAAAKLNIPVAHVEAGLRCHKRHIAEELNRLLADHLSTLLLCPTETAVRKLRREGIDKGVHHVGDVMYDAVLFYREKAKAKAGLLKRLGLKRGKYLLATVHHAEITDHPKCLRQVLAAFSRLGEPIVFPVHPRTREAMRKLRGWPNLHLVNMIEPVSYLETLCLADRARMILTDSGGLQKEAYFLGTPCVTLTEEEEWVETIDAGANRLVGTDPERIIEAVRAPFPRIKEPTEFGDGQAAAQIAFLVRHFGDGEAGRKARRRAA